MKLQVHLKAVVLAAGSKSISEDGQPVLMQEFGGKKVIDHVMENVAQVVPPGETYVVVSYHGEAVRKHLEPDYLYCTQVETKGTGHSSLTLRSQLQSYEGDLLILYGDTPLFNPTSIRGLINRHRLRNADLTILTAVADHDYPYGRVIRDSDGRIIDIIEQDDASSRVKKVRELNVGAYVVSAYEIWPMLAALPRRRSMANTAQFF
jgi:bifunctional UDP-N-acetylglucosamine pyrophosphorylase/glucosamine-1-phosphate N-acetyltransferase